MSEPLTCPVCRANNTQRPTCRRCKADLSLLFSLADQRAQALQAAQRAAQAGHWAQTLALALGADALRSGADSRQLIALSYLMQGQFAAALTWHGLATQGAFRS